MPMHRLLGQAGCVVPKLTCGRVIRSFCLLYATITLPVLLLLSPSPERSQSQRARPSTLLLESAGAITARFPIPNRSIQLLQALGLSFAALCSQ